MADDVQDGGLDGGIPEGYQDYQSYEINVNELLLLKVKADLLHQAIKHLLEANRVMQEMLTQHEQEIAQLKESKARHDSEDRQDW